VHESGGDKSLGKQKLVVTLYHEYYEIFIILQNSRYLRLVALTIEKVVNRHPYQKRLHAFSCFIKDVILLSEAF